MTPANLALWFNVSTLSFAAGPLDTSPFFAPLGLVQNTQLTIDVYYVQPTGNASSPWTYLDPATFLQAGLSIGNRFNFSSYANTAAFTRYVDANGPKARFTLNLVSSQLNSDLGSLASIGAILQATAQTGSSTPVAQLSALIAKALGNGGFGNGFVIVLPNVVSLTGNTTTALAGIPTANGAMAPGSIIQVVGVNTAGVSAQYQLQAFSGSQSLPAIVLPNDYDSVANPVAWVEVA